VMAGMFSYLIHAHLGLAQMICRKAAVNRHSSDSQTASELQVLDSRTPR
jgi:hypothetical protein